MPGGFERQQAKIDEALRLLGISNFLLGIHDPAFPSLPTEEIGRGSPYSAGAAAFLQFVRALGFNGLQLGPQGITTPVNASPYDGTLFSRNPLSLAPHRLSEPPWQLFPADKLAALTAKPPAPANRVHPAFAAQLIDSVTAEGYRRLQAGPAEPPSDAAALRKALALFRQRHADWLERDALYEVLRHRYGKKSWRCWGEDQQARLDQVLPAPPAGKEQAAAAREAELRRLYHQPIEQYCLIQFLLADQHRQLKKQCRLLGLKLFGDCQIGLSSRDAWHAQSFLLKGYVMGAPPSRTNPKGQAWNYPVLDPRQYYRAHNSRERQPGPALIFWRERLTKLLAEFDGLRLDHPHGLVCPWVYRAGQADPQRAVREGARLFASPALADHPELAQFAIPRPEQIDSSKPRDDEHWVIDLDSAQVRRYAVLLELIMTAARQGEDGSREIACEILSTQPYPIKRVMELYGLGRFRVTQKADLDNPLDVYRGENAKPQDWLMLGSHDTPSIWQRTEQWVSSGRAGQQAAYLADRLRIPTKERQQWQERTAADPGRLAQAKFAELFVGPACNIMVFFTDLLGIKEAYNIPGTISPSNWSLRITPDYRQKYAALAGRDRALNIPAALAAGLRARAQATASSYSRLITELDELARLAGEPLFSSSQSLDK